MSVWFDGHSNIDVAIGDISRAVGDPGEHFVAVVGDLPGLTSVELVDQGPGFVTIRTNEGLMERTGISTTVEPEQVVVEFDERYQAGKKVTATTHFLHEFTPAGDGVDHHLVMSDVKAPGFLGWMYRTFGAKKMGNAFLSTYKVHFEK